MSKIGQAHLVDLEWLPPQESGGDQDALLQASGERVMARTFERQVVELHVWFVLLNRFTHLGRPTTVSVAAVA